VSTIKLIRGDCLQELRKLPDKSIDCVFADLPFYQEAQEELGDERYSGLKAQEKKIVNYSIWNEKLAAEVDRVLVDGGNIIIVNAPRYILSTIGIWLNRFVFRSEVPLIRRGSLRPAWMLGFQHNLMVFLTKGDKKIKWRGAVVNHDKSQPTDVWTDIPYQNGYRAKGIGNWHPEAINIEVVERAILLNTNPGDTVLDITMGSGTAGVVCKKLGLNFIGIELDEHYFNIAKTRIENSL
jgi:DNA modification methylase